MPTKLSAALAAVVIASAVSAYGSTNNLSVYIPFGGINIPEGTTNNHLVKVVVNGPDAIAEDITLSIPLPAGTTTAWIEQSVGVPATCTATAGNVSCHWATLPVSVGYAEFNYFVTAGTTSYTVNANVSLSGTDPDPSDNSASYFTRVYRTADLAVSASGPATATAGANVEYTITAANVGSKDSPARVIDELPHNMTLLSMAQTSGPAFDCSGATCTHANFAAGATATFTVIAQLASSAASGSTVVNQVFISPGPGVSDTNSSDNAATSSATVATSADVAIAKSGPSSVAPGTNASWTITVTNNGWSDAANVVVTEVVPPQTSLVSMTQTGGSTSFSCAGSTCSIATFPALASATFEVVLAVDSSASGSITNSATVSSATSDPNPGNESASSGAAEVVPPTADLSIAAVANGTSFNAGENVTWTITAANHGPLAATDAVVNITIPSGTTFVSATPSQGSCSAAANVTCTLGTIAANGNATITFTVTLPSFAAEIASTSSVSSTRTDPNPANNTSTSTVFVAGPPDPQCIATFAAQRFPQARRSRSRHSPAAPIRSRSNGSKAARSSALPTR